MADDKIFKYKGKTIEELKKLSMEELMVLLPSDLRRKMKRGFTEEEKKLLARFRANDKVIKTHARDMFVLPEMVGKKIGVYNGKEFIDVNLVDEMVSLRLGELVPTRKSVTHTAVGGNKKKEDRK